MQLIEGYPALQPNNKFISKFVSGFAPMLAQVASNPETQKMAFDFADRGLTTITNAFNRPSRGQRRIDNLIALKRAGLIRGAENIPENETPQQRKARLLRAKRRRRVRRPAARRSAAARRPVSPVARKNNFETPQLILPSSIDVTPMSQMQPPMIDQSQSVSPNAQAQEVESDFTESEFTTDAEGEDLEGFAWLAALARHGARGGGARSIVSRPGNLLRSAGNVAVAPLRMQANLVRSVATTALPMAQSILPMARTMMPGAPGAAPAATPAQQAMQSQPQSSTPPPTTESTSSDTTSQSMSGYDFSGENMNEILGAGFAKPYRLTLNYALRPGKNPNARVDKPRGVWTQYLHNPALKRMSVMVRSPEMKNLFLNAFSKMNPSFRIVRTSGETPATGPVSQARPARKKIIARKPRQSRRPVNKNVPRPKPGILPEAVSDNAQPVIIPKVLQDTEEKRNEIFQEKEIIPVSNKVPAAGSGSKIKNMANGILPAAIIIWLAHLL